MDQKWMILLAVILLSLFQYGSLKALEISIPRLIEQLGMSAALAGLGCSIAAAIATLLGPVWAAAEQKTSNRFVTIFGGLLMGAGLILISILGAYNSAFVYIGMAILGIGRGLPMVGKVTILKEYFKDHFNMANGVASAGGSVGLMVLPPFLEFLISTCGWRSSLSIIGGVISINLIIAGIMMKSRDGNGTPAPDNRECGSQNSQGNHGNNAETTFNSEHSTSKENHENDNRALPDTDTQKSETNTQGISNDRRGQVNADRYLLSCCKTPGLTSLKRKPVFCFYLIAFALFDLALTGWILFLFTYTTSIGFKGQQAASLSLFGGVGSLIGRLVCGPLMDKKVLSAGKLLVLSATLGCVFLALYPSTTSYGGLIGISLLTGIFVGTTTPLYTGLIKEMFQDKQGTSPEKEGTFPDVDKEETIPEEEQIPYSACTLGLHSITRLCGSTFRDKEKRKRNSNFAGAVGLHYMMRGIGMLCGGPLTGWIFDVTGSFNLAFYTLAGFEAFGGLYVLCAELLVAKDEPEESEKPEKPEKPEES